MDDCAVNEAKVQLDAALSNANPNIGIMFGLELFREFRNRNWLTLEHSSVLGTGLFEGMLPAYQKTHCAVVSWDIPEDQFRVGKNA